MVKDEGGKASLLLPRSPLHLSWRSGECREAKLTSTKERVEVEETDFSQQQTVYIGWGTRTLLCVSDCSICLLGNSHISTAALCSLVKIDDPAEQIFVSYELIYSCSLRHTCNYS